MDKNLASKPANRGKIEVDLIERHKKLKNKLSFIKVKKIKAQLDKNYSVPIISPRSALLASKSKLSLFQGETRLKKTHEILKSVKMLPKKVKLSISNLKAPSKHFKIISKKLVRYDKVMSSPKQEEVITFPSLEKLSNWEEYSVSDIPADISRRNQLIYNLKSQDLIQEESSSRSLSLSQRSRLWLDKKQYKAETSREKSENVETEPCTFRPRLGSKSTSKAATSRDFSTKSVESYQISEKFGKISSSTPKSISVTSIIKKINSEDSARVLKQFNTTVSTHDGSNTMCPISMNVSYSSGYSPSLKRKSKPLINYSVLNVRI
jgi:hypothetical protein